MSDKTQCQTCGPNSERLGALESGARHLRETMDSREANIWRYLAELKALSQDQAKEREREAQETRDTIEDLRTMALRTLLTLTGVAFTTLLAIVLKALKLY